ncbi:MAG: hypothetical protein E7254_02020 [Lachnospiraceae bacterium]|nr:hypothetical protein [Lachnospiraceae bacterium]
MGRLLDDEFKNEIKDEDQDKIQEGIEKVYGHISFKTDETARYTTKNYDDACSGLELLYSVNIALIFVSISLLIPVINILGAIALLVCMVLILIGYYNIGKDIEGCKTAFYIYAVSIVFSIIDGIFIDSESGIVTIFILISFILEVAADIFFWNSLGKEVNNDIDASDLCKYALILSIITSVFKAIENPIKASSLSSGVILLFLIISLIISLASYIVTIKAYKASYDAL